MSLERELNDCNLCRTERAQTECAAQSPTHNASVGSEVRGTEDFMEQLQVWQTPVLHVGELRHLCHGHQALVIHVMVQTHHLVHKVPVGQF